MELVPVRARDCECPGAPHGEDGDIVYILPKPSLDLGLAWQLDMSESADASGAVKAAEVKPRWYRPYARHGAVGWNLLDADGAPVPFDIGALLADFSLAYPAADKADDLYAEALVRPLADRLSGLSQNGRMNGSTSRTPQSIRKPRGRLSRPVSAASTP